MDISNNNMQPHILPNTPSSIITHINNLESPQPPPVVRQPATRSLPDEPPIFSDVQRQLTY